MSFKEFIKQKIIGFSLLIFALLTIEIFLMIYNFKFFIKLYIPIIILIVYFLGIFIVKKDYEKTKLRIRKSFKKDYRGVPLVKENKVWTFNNYKYSCTALDKLYDLIQAGLVEKM